MPEPVALALDPYPFGTLVPNCKQTNTHKAQATTTPPPARCLLPHQSSSSSYLKRYPSRTLLSSSSSRLLYNYIYSCPVHSFFKMREVISINGLFSPDAMLTATTVSNKPNGPLLTYISIVGQAGCQIANSCWEVSFNRRHHLRYHTCGREGQQY